MLILFINWIPISIQMLPDENQKLKLIKQIRKALIIFNRKWKKYITQSKWQTAYLYK